VSIFVKKYLSTFQWPCSQRKKFNWIRTKTNSSQMITDRMNACWKNHKNNITAAIKNLNQLWCQASGDVGLQLRTHPILRKMETETKIRRQRKVPKLSLFSFLCVSVYEAE
jgi:hypothetical protein